MAQKLIQDRVGAEEPGESPQKAMQWLNKDGIFCQECGKSMDGASTEWTAAAQGRYAWLGNTRGYRCRECGVTTAMENLHHQQEKRPHSQQDWCCEPTCRVLLIRPGRKDTNLPPNISKRQFNEKSHGDRRCMACSKSHSIAANKDHEMVLLENELREA